MSKLMSRRGIPSKKEFYKKIDGHNYFVQIENTLLKDSGNRISSKVELFIKDGSVPSKNYFNSLMVFLKCRPTSKKGYSRMFLEELSMTRNNAFSDFQYCLGRKYKISRELSGKIFQKEFEGLKKKMSKLFFGTMEDFYISIK